MSHDPVQSGALPSFHPIFDPRDSRCKSPFGAAPLQTEVCFTLRPPLREGVRRAFLLLRHEFSGEEQELPMASVGREDGCALFRLTLTVPDAPELLWYHFRLEGKQGARLFDRQGFVQEREVEPFQLTVYRKNETPQWFGQGVSYQIFPDRFCRSHIPDASEMIGARKVHMDWEEPLDYQSRQEEPQWCYDFFGGDLRGITEKLPYLASLSVRTIYLCPIFESSSNHRYNTADYLRIDPMLGDEEDFRTLCAEAAKLGIRVMIDGVFNHSGHDSRYFNASGYFPEPGATQSQDSPYYPWYRFTRWPKEYESWWGIFTLPAVNELCPSYLDFIVTGQDSVVRRWLRAGASAWRLDVADELPDEFIRTIRTVMEEEKPDAFLMGEVWEDGSNKVAYGERRRYLLGDELHGLMNYPFRRAALDYLRGGDAAAFYEAMETLRENYPPDAFYAAMNFLSTHDTPRMLTLLGAAEEELPRDKAERCVFRLSPAQRTLAERRLALGALLLYCFPGSPLLYYGDEAGMEGLEDPFNRGTYPWGKEDASLLRFHRALGALRAGRVSLQKGDIRYLYAQGHGLAFSRSFGGETSLLVLNAGDTPLTLSLPWDRALARDALEGQRFFADGGELKLTLPPLSGLLLI
ncbi:MAG: glycoside hydrolase family 13 protein [Oscillospiraceae bacterium]